MSVDHDHSLEEELKRLKKRYETLNTKKIEVDRDLKNFRSHLDQLEREAVEKYGTADPDKLEDLLKEKREENKSLVTEYTAHLQTITAELEKVETESEAAK